MIIKQKNKTCNINTNHDGDRNVLPPHGSTK